jgi:hypothetical protein
MPAQDCLETNGSDEARLEADSEARERGPAVRCRVENCLAVAWPLVLILQGWDFADLSLPVSSGMRTQCALGVGTS